jgi:hypothetical protein
MALWQFDLHCLPSAVVVERLGHIPLAMTRADFDNFTWWERQANPGGIASQFDRFLPRTSSWSSKNTTWGQEDGNRIDLVASELSVMDIFIRIDVRDFDLKFLTFLIRCADVNKWVFLTQESYVIAPSLPKLLSAIRRSASFRFVINPEEFLSKLKAAGAGDPDS